MRFFRSQPSQLTTPALTAFSDALERGFLAYLCGLRLIRAASVGANLV
jgi:hypothetical protein